jgi:hypothetical protein
MISSVRNFVVRILDADRFTIALFQILNIKSNYLPGIVHYRQALSTFFWASNDTNPWEFSTIYRVERRDKSIPCEQYNTVMKERERLRLYWINVVMQQQEPLQRGSSQAQYNTVPVPIQHNYYAVPIISYIHTMIMMMIQWQCDNGEIAGTVEHNTLMIMHYKGK